MVKKEKTQTNIRVAHHIVPEPSGKWAIKRNGANKAIQVFSTKGDALEFAREMGRKQSIEIVIHGRDGKVMSTHTFGEVVQSEARPESGFGCARGLIVMPPHFDEPLEEFNEYI